MVLRDSSPLRIAFGNLCTKSWIAGCHYLKNLFIALKTQPNAPELILYGRSADGTDAMLAEYLSETLDPPVARFRGRQLIGRLERRFGVPLGAGRDHAALLRDQGIDAIFAGDLLGSAFDLPHVAWLPDFQHVHLPHMFSQQEREGRDRIYRRTVRWSNRIILSSHSALEDLEKFAPEDAPTGRVVNFTAQVSPTLYDHDPAWVRELHHLPDRFFYLPNQFWKHKNHETVVEALGLLKAKGTPVTVVCSGNTNDSRNPDYFSALKSRIQSLGIEDQFIILGMIPHDHIFPLIRQSLAVLQPSLFEAWSTSVEETKSIGKHIIVSDLPVHREQNPPQARYFVPRDPQALADALIEVDAKVHPGPDLELEQSAREDLPRRTSAFGEAFMRVIAEIL
ncbi:MAG: glycosyltransferase family 4 protein [Chloroflexi bacterium]|nr:glycosyltransferase family 4 protein [Chloroflexota bacterium]